VCFSDLKEDPHCVMMQSSAKPLELVTEGDTAVNDGQNCSSDKTPNMEEKLQEVEKVKIIYELFYLCRNCNVA
jgi:hypothetical protein